MSVAEILQELEQQKVVVFVHGNRLRLRAPAGWTAPEGLFERLRATKAELLLHLQAAGQAGQTAAQAGQMGKPDFAAYAERMEKALAAIEQPDYPAGMVFWLSEAYPRFYAQLTDRLPAEIHLLWSERAPLEQFQRVLDRLLETHREACALYQAHLSRKKNGQGRP
jgi:TubC N-terminal docking domain